uniref:hypothetical protein n=1 Tax=Clostridium baratii TaxID=1561 RepID=UPI001C222443
MTASPVYLHALGMVNALGDDVSAIRRNLATGHAPGMRAADRPDGSIGMVGRALAALELEPPARL